MQRKFLHISGCGGRLQVLEKCKLVITIISLLEAIFEVRHSEWYSSEHWQLLFIERKECQRKMCIEVLHKETNGGR